MNICLSFGPIDIDISKGPLSQFNERYVAHRGSQGLVSKQRGRPANNRISSAVRRQALAVIRPHYDDFRPAFASEKRAEVHDLCLSRETVRQLMIADGSWVTRDKRLKRAYPPRYRRACCGELVQIDGSHHRWFEDRNPKCTLLVYIDDATGKLMELWFTETASTFTYFEATRRYLQRHGISGTPTILGRARVYCGERWVSQYSSRIKITHDGRVLPYTVFDKLHRVDQGAVVDNKRLGRVLSFIQEQQHQRDEHRSQHAPSRRHLGTASTSAIRRHSL